MQETSCQIIVNTEVMGPDFSKLVHHELNTGGAASCDASGFGTGSSVRHGADAPSRGGLTADGIHGRERPEVGQHARRRAHQRGQSQSESTQPGIVIGVGPS